MSNVMDYSGLTFKMAKVEADSVSADTVSGTSDATDVAVDTSTTSLSGANLQAVLEDLAARITALEP